MQKTYHGSCHCGAVRFAADLDLEAGSFRCNCSICSKARSWLAPLAADALRVLEGEEQLSVYQFGAHRIRHLFCPRCGVRPFGRAADPATGADMAVVNLACLDDVSDAELAATPIAYLNGRDDDFQSPPAETRYL
ncbi:GFA family protein [Algiphilus aromaticivorans]|uniref:GFA family protein n=1 Tax=Algiphilus aromaticivorans TaxID=382454 RepID=UPI0005C1B472|nr:GFA family protein [Algiphilus aromaticivorans]